MGDKTVTTRYVRLSLPGEQGAYRWVEVGEDPRYNVREGNAEAHELPEEVRAGADARKGLFPAYVEWPK